ncbi:MAG TPA: DNA methyltransferase [Terriglobia bacterium]|nr:DNA methyltransferase [Terriglobia bacterium]
MNGIASDLQTQIIYCGDCLQQLSKLPEACIDLIYIDPPFNSNRNYEVFWGEAKEKRSFEDRHASTAAYIDFMRPRCVQLARVLKPAGSFYYHCDWHASHYVKVMLDQIFGENNFQNEIVWKRSDAKGDAGQGAKHFGRCHDSIMLYTGGSNDWTFNRLYTPFSEEYIETFYRHKDSDGRRWKRDNLLGPGGAGKGNAKYEFLGVTRYWRYTKEKMEDLYRAGRVVQMNPGVVPMYKRYLDEAKGVPLTTWWDDIKYIHASSHERLGYPTQKPVTLLDRIVQTSSNPGNIVLDAFCGCGTALVSAQNLGRKWIGIDISPTACRVMAKRLGRDCGLIEGKSFVVRGLPWAEGDLRKIPHFEFENWAVIALGGIPNKAKVGDMGIDGKIYPVSSMPAKSGKKAGELDFMDTWYPIQVKQKDKVGRPDIDSFEAVMQRENRLKGFFVSFDYSEDAKMEVDAFFRRSHKVIIPLTVREILDEEIAAKLA